MKFLFVRKMSNFNGLALLSNYTRTISRICRYNRRFSSSNKRNGSNLLTYTAEQQMQILDTLHKCAVNNITRVHLNEKRLEGLRMLFEQKPNMRNLEPLLTVNSFGPKVLSRICESIIQELEHSGTEKQANQPRQVINDIETHSLKLPSNLVTPAHVSQSSVERVVSVHLGINAVSWARLQTASPTAAELDTWGVMDITQHADKKYDVHSVWNLVTLLREEIPDGDVYVMENNNWSNIANIKKPMKYHILEAMITAAFCSVFNQSECGNQPRPEVDNRVYFLRPFTPSRLFRKVVGSERVSAQDVVQNMMDGILDPWHRPITFHTGTVEQYRSVSGYLRDNMSQSLLLVISFMELVLLQNPAAISVIGRSQNSRKR